MKKCFVLGAALLMGASLCAFAACDEGEQSDGGGTGTGSSSAFRMAGDLQALYGENGYPQAVLVAKKDFSAENAAFIEDFTDAVAANAAWLLEEDIHDSVKLKSTAPELPHYRSKADA